MILSFYIYLQYNVINTKQGERGISLSGGQIQRIGTASVFYKDAEFFILDQATLRLILLMKKM